MPEPLVASADVAMSEEEISSGVTNNKAVDENNHISSGSSYLSVLNLDPELVIPIVWNIHDKCTCLDVSFDKYTVEYTCKNFNELKFNFHCLRVIALGRNDNEAATIRANTWIPLAMGIFYYEVKILHKGVHGYYGIGICGPNVSLTRLPGNSLSDIFVI